MVTPWTLGLKTIKISATVHIHISTKPSIKPTFGLHLTNPMLPTLHQAVKTPNHSVPNHARGSPVRTDRLV